MKTRILAALLAAVALPAVAFAAPPVAPTGTLALKDTNLAAQSEIIIPAPGYTGSAPVPFYLGHVNLGQSSTAAGFLTETIDSSDFGLWSHTVNGALEAGGNLAKLQAANGTPADPAGVATDTTPESEVALLKGLIVKLNALVTALGSPAQAGGGLVVGSAPASTANPVPVSTATGPASVMAEQAIQANTKLPSSFGPVTAGTAFNAGVGLAAVCTTAGNLVLDAADGSSITLPVGVGFNQFGFAVVKVDSASTATCTNIVLR